MTILPEGNIKPTALVKENDLVDKSQDTIS